MATTIIDADRISQLPDHIVHYILSFLSIEEVVRVSVLSKAWNGFFTCFPLSDFYYVSFDSIVSDRKLKFANFVYSSLLRQCLHSTRILKFKLSMCEDCDNDSTSPQLLCESTDLINRSIQLSIQYGVKDLSLDFSGSYNYRLPEAIFSSKELVVFSLFYCSLDSTINWPSLREFSLTYVYISDPKIIDNLSFTCPLIEKFSLIYCKGIGDIKLLGLPKLKKVKIHGCVSQRIEIASSQLERLQLYTDSNAIIINAPRLQLFEYKFRGLPSMFSINKASLHEVCLRLSLYHLYYKYDIHFLKYLTEYLRNFNQINLLTLKISNWAYFGLHTILRNISHPVFLDINHLKLKMSTNQVFLDHANLGKRFEALVDYIFCMCRPESLTLMVDWDTQAEVMKVLCKKLVSFKVDDQYCCADNKVKCWRHDLKDIQIERYGEHCDSEVVTYEALLDSMHPLDLKKNIRFVFEW